MKEIELQNYLRYYGLETLQSRFRIKASQDKQYPELYCLKYSQIESPMSEIVVQQCRGIIVDSSKDWEIVSYAYNKFFNHGEALAAEIDWSSAKVYEKLDGSLMTLYFYNGCWRVQSSGSPDASGEVNGFSFTFADLFWRVWNELGYKLTGVDEDYCYSFELMTLYNRVVVDHKINRLVLHGVRNIKTLEQFEPSKFSDRYGWELVKTYPLRSWKEVTEAADELDPFVSEGYVVLDRQFQRVKVKGLKYTAYHYLRDNMSPRKMLEVVLANEGSEFLTYYPEWDKLYDEISSKYNALVSEIEEAYAKYRSIEGQKDFALQVKDLPYSGVLFSLRAGKATSVKESLSKATLQKVSELLGLKESVEVRVDE